jgi:nitrate reductase molybdenum cofactor assembly chaperone NarJ/NarW
MIEHTMPSAAQSAQVEHQETPMAIQYRMLSLLLEYPDEALMSVLWQVRELIDTDPQGWDAQPREALKRFLDRLESRPLTELQADYVRTFDLTPEHSLHLTLHLFGDDKNRGPALIDLSEFYRAHGLDLSANELPDYLPVMLEFASTLPEDEALDFLGQLHRVLRVLAANLERADSPYAAVVRVVEARAALRAPAEAAPGSPAGAGARKVIPIRREEDLPSAFEPPGFPS